MRRNFYRRVCSDCSFPLQRDEVLYNGGTCDKCIALNIERNRARVREQEMAGPALDKPPPGRHE